MSWRDKLQKAKFRDAAFFVDSADTGIGRRTVVHEYPLRDDPYAEDMGRKAKEFSVECYVLGTDYMVARDALIAALDAAGPGTLIHPYYGARRVVATSARVKESTNEGGMARFSVTFTEAGVNENPSAVAGTQEVVVSKADIAKAVILSDFSKVFSVKNQPGFVSQAAADLVSKSLASIDVITSAVGLDKTMLSQIQADGLFLAGSVSTLINAPGSLANAIFGRIAAIASIADAPLAAINMLQGLFGWGSSELTVPQTTPARIAQASNQIAITNLIRRASLVEAARTSSEVTFPSYNDAITLRDNLSEQLDVEAEVASSGGIVGSTATVPAAASDVSYEALTALRVAVVRDVTTRGADLSRIRTVTPAATLPSLVLAHRFYNDATRDQEIVDRNHVRHPGFVPGGVPLEVLTNAA